MSAIKPINTDAVIKMAKDTGRVAENHNIHRGFGSAVAEVFGEHYSSTLVESRNKRYPGLIWDQSVASG